MAGSGGKYERQEEPNQIYERQESLLQLTCNIIMARTGALRVPCLRVGMVYVARYCSGRLIHFYKITMLHFAWRHDLCKYLFLFSKFQFPIRW